MAHPAAAASEAPEIHARPAAIRPFRIRTVAASLVVAGIISGSYPYIVLKLGFAPNYAVVPALLGYLMLGLFCRDFSRWENNIIQTAGSSAGSTAFLCVLMAAFDLLHRDPTLHFGLTLTPLEAFLWLTTAGSLGVLLAVPMRQHFIVDEQLAYPGGVVAAEILAVLDAKGKDARDAAASMGIGTALSSILMLLRKDARLLGNVWYRIPELLAFGPTSGLGFGLGWSLLSLGSGMIVGFRVCLGMLIGTVLAWGLAPGLLLQRHAVDHLARKDVLLWVMWPATAMLIASGLAALLLRWRILIRTFKSLASANIRSGDFPMRWVVMGSLASGTALVAFQKIFLGTPVWISLIAIALSIPLMLVGLRVLGETNWAPTSALANMMQAIFGVIAPGQIAPNMAASGIAGSVVGEAEGLMQDFKTGHIIDNPPRYLTYAQLLAVPVGAATVACVYPLLRATYGIGGENGLQSPISQKWAGLAQLLSKGLSALPPGALEALVVAGILGIVLTIFESTRFKSYTPSPTGIGIGMLVPTSAITAMFLGSVIDFWWRRHAAQSWKRIRTPLASGFIAGEAIIAVILPILVAVGLLHLQH